jgi:hypothetical protein
MLKMQGRPHFESEPSNCGVAGIRLDSSALRKEILQSVKKLLPDRFWILRNTTKPD